ncbi:hypothetical protein RISW2_20635 [Roseivivax isoporae LMG 25204]|uniref:Uncharacterized protein n=1 Tax=Roseivivax isoporae LMG 25204 TaxID=1449351 RepID=X7F3M9_9RHOB|nr:hypothetical protein RISW2_20635 [Roseivivax isoporae LMG 25204]
MQIACCLLKTWAQLVQEFFLLVAFELHRAITFLKFPQVRMHERLRSKQD